MKKSIALTICLSLLLAITSCIPMRTIEGDGNVVTEKITITDYTALTLAGGKIEAYYEQSEKEPELTVTTDKNILDIFLFEVENGKLKIKPQKKYEKMYRIKPTEFTIRTNSTTIKSFKLAGSNKLTINSPLVTDKLEISIAGSGYVDMPDRAEINDLETHIAGSGTLRSAEAVYGEFDAEIAGSGTLILGGEANKVSLSIAGSGEVKGFDLQSKELSCSIAGSGDVEMSVSDKINVEIAGSGKIRYKGDPEITKKVAGSGSIKKVD